MAFSGQDFHPGRGDFQGLLEEPIVDGNPRRVLEGLAGPHYRILPAGQPGQDQPERVVAHERGVFHLHRRPEQGPGRGVAFGQGLEDLPLSP